MAKAPQRACEHYCIISELYRLIGVPTHSDDETLVLTTPINSSTMRKFQAHQQQRGVQQGQDDNQERENE